MSDPATEIAYLPLKANLDLESGEAKSAWESTLATIAKQPGFQTLFWGRQVENKDILQLVVVWDSLSAHQTFIAAPEYQPFLSNLKDHILGGAPTLFHVRLPVEDLTPFLQPVTECVSAYFPPSHSEEEYSSNFSTFQTEAAKIPNVEAKGLIGGWSVEKHEHENLGQGVQGKMFGAFIGWPSVDAHMEFRKTVEFGKIIGLLRGGTEGVRVWHVAFNKYQ